MAAKGNGGVFVCEWEIENFLMWDEVPLRCEFVASNLFQSRWGLTIEINYFATPFEHNTAGFCCRLERCSNSIGIREMVVNWGVEMADAEGKTLASFTETECLFLEGTDTVEETMEFKELCDILSQGVEDTLTIVCTIEICKPLEDNDVSTCNRCKAKTTFNKNEYKFDVNVPIPLPTEPVLSFTVESAEVQVVIFTRRGGGAVIKTESTRFLGPLLCHVHLLDVDGKRIKSINEFRKFLEAKEKWMFRSFFSLKELLDNDKIYLDKNSFKIIFHFILPSKEKKTFSISYIDCPVTNDSMECLKKEFLTMLKTSNHSDVQLLTINKGFPVHKSVLAARSPVFSAMFEHDMLESRTGSVDCADLDSDIAESLLEFLYSGTAKQPSVSHSVKLMLAADKYEVPTLVQECSRYLKSVLSEENVCEVVAAADMISHKELKEAAIDFFIRNADRVLSTPKWPDWLRDNVLLGSAMLNNLSVYLKNSVRNK